MSKTTKERLKEVRAEMREITDERRELLKEYRYWKRKELKLKEVIFNEC